jgi:hypothetical protein
MTMRYLGFEDCRQTILARRGLSPGADASFNRGD